MPYGSLEAYQSANGWRNFTNIAEYDPATYFEENGIRYKFDYSSATTVCVLPLENGEYYSGDIVIPSWVNYNYVTYDVTAIGNEAFYNCSALTSVELPNSLASIGDKAFGFCSGLTSIELPNSVTSIGVNAFWGCTGLTSILIPDNVTTIKEWTFASCLGLSSIVIPDRVTSIGPSAFANCRGLVSVELPKSVTSIGDEAFYDCSALKSICFKGSVPCTVGSITFYNVPYKDVTLYVPIGSLSAYQSHSSWKYFGYIVERQQPEAGKYYRIKSYRSQDAKSCLSMVNAYAPVDGIPVMKNADDSYRAVVRVSAEDAVKDLSSLWTPVAADGGVGTALKNANMSCYLGKDQYCSPNQTGAGYCYFGVGSISGTVTIQNFQDGSGYLQDDGDNSIVRTDAPDAEGKLWYFEEVASVPVEIGAAGWASLVLPYAVTLPDGVDAYYAENGIAGDVLTLKKWQELDLPAYMPVFLMGTAGEYALTITTTDVEKPENVLKGHTMKRMHFSDGEPNPSVTFENIYALRKNEAALGLVTGINAFPANRAYVEAPTNAAKEVRFGFGNATGMADAAIQQWSAKDEIYYDMNGRRVWNPKRGIYVTASGKTVFINK